MSQIINGYVGNIIVVIGVFMFARIVLKEPIKVSKKRFIIDFFISTIIYTIILINLNGTIKSLCMSLVMIAFYKDIFKDSYRKLIFLTFLYLIILIITELLEVLILTDVFNMSKSYCYNEFAGSILSNLMVSVLFLILTYLIRKILRKIVNIRLENNIKIIIFSILIFTCIGMLFYTFIREFRVSDNIIIYIIAIIVLAVVLFSLIKQTIENNKLSRDYDKLLEFMVTYENEIEKQRVLRHEIKNEFRTIRAKIYDKEKNQEIIKYIDNIVDDKYEMNQEKYAKFGYLPPNGIKGLCYFKIQEAENKGVSASINISKRIKNSVIYKLNVKNQRDFGRILGVFLDNAIEASLKSEEKKIGIEAYINIKKDFEMIITNTYNNEIDKTKIGKEKFSTKGKNRGHGLLLVKHITSKNNLIEIKTEIQDTIYIQKIKIKQL